MKAVPTMLVLTALATLLLCAPAASLAQQEKPPEMSPEMQAEMEAWMKVAQPGPHHEHLAPFVGSWKGKVQMWMTPDGPPMEEESTAEVAWLLGGRYLEWRITGNFAGMPYEARAIEGYNNVDQRYESTWIDNFGTLILFFTGSCSHDGKSRTMATHFQDVVSGGTVGYRTDYEWIDDDHFRQTAYMDKGEGEVKQMVINYTRQ
jgi:hypothetical protein